MAESVRLACSPETRINPSRPRNAPSITQRPGESSGVKADCCVVAGIGNLTYGDSLYYRSERKVWLRA